MNDLNDDRAYKAMLKKEVQLERELRDEIERLRAEVEYWKGYTEQAMQHRDEAERLWHRETAAELQRLRAENANQRELIAWSIGDPTDAAQEIERLRAKLHSIDKLGRYITWNELEALVREALGQKEAKDAAARRA